MKTKQAINDYLNGIKNTVIEKKVLKEKLQTLLETKNGFEDGGVDGDFAFTMYFTNTKADSYPTSKLCDIYIGYFKTRDKNFIYVTDCAILNYIP